MVWSRTRQYLSKDTSSLCCSTRLLMPLLLSLFFSQTTSKQQCIMLQRHNISTSEHFFGNFWLSLIVFLVLVTAHSVEEISGCISSETVTAIYRPLKLPLCSHFCPDSIFQFFLGNSKIQQNCGQCQLFEIVIVTESGEKVVYSCSVLSFAYWRMKNPTKIGFLCSVCAFASSTLNNEIFTWSGFLNSLLWIAACVFLSLSYFVTVCRLRSIIW